MRKTLVCFTLCIMHHALCIAQLTPLTDSIPMRDGKKLAVDIYRPNNGVNAMPTILIQTPYDRTLYKTIGLPLGIKYNINNSNYNIVIVDWRCFYGSTNACVANVNRGQDGYDCVGWITAQPWSNGKVGTWGASALGVCQFQTAKENPPGLVCCVPIVAGPQTRYFDYFPGGVYRTEYVQMLDILGYGLSTTLLANTVYSLAWQVTENQSFYPQSIPVPMFMIGGWYDHNIDDMLPMFAGLRSSSPLSVRDKHRLMMGPWTHNKSSDSPALVGQLSYPEAAGWSDSLSLKFFDYHIRNIANGWASTPYVQYFQMGENTWKNDTAWYTGNMMNYKLYLWDSKILSPDKSPTPTKYIPYQYDPRNPSPTVGGPTLRYDLQQGPYDQSPVVESRNDILVFSTPPLSQNVVMRGAGQVHLFISSDRFDTDFSVRLTDVYPDGRSMLINDGIRRMRFRNGYYASDTAIMVPGNIYESVIDLPATAITFLAGHRIRLDVTSSNYPRFDRNLNNGQKMYVAGDTLVASNTVYADAVYSSYVTLPLLSFPAGLEEVNAAQPFFIFPNPAHGSFSIHFPDQKMHHVKIYSSIGAIVAEGLFNNSEKIQLSSSGIYYLVDETSKHSQKLIIVD